MIDHYDDDSHFCLKCRTTIIGLDNYVTHRKSNCAKFDKSIEKSIIPIELLPQDDSFTLNADDFFMSLELQSSAKKQTSTITAAGPSNTTAKTTLSGIRTRSKTSAAIQGTTKEDKEEIPKSGGGKNAWIGGHQLKELGTGDNQSKLLKAVDNLSRHAIIKKVDPPQQLDQESEQETDDDSNEYDSDFDEDEDEDEHYPPKTHTGGKWKPCSPIHWSSNPSTPGGKWKPKDPNIPPPSHTKGKWKPAPQHQSTSGKVDYDSLNIPPPSFTGSKWTPSKAKLYDDGPSSSYTKGKWKPASKSSERRYSDDDEDDTIEQIHAKRRKSDSPSVDKQRDMISPTYTKGKWLPITSSCQEEGFAKQEIPFFRKSSGSIQYWCSPCNRRLASKVVYERHLISNLHRKRAIQDFDDISKFTTRVKPKHLPRQVKNIRTNITYNEDTKKIRRKVYIKCTVCSSKVHSHQMGKHLISHYHCRRGNIDTEEAHKLVLDYIYDIVIQSPFQCAACTFYCNTFEYFIQHWLSQKHNELVDKMPGYFLCSFCNKKCESSHEMYYHLMSQEHKEVISVINRSVPIVIKRINPMQCLSCEQEFLYNIELIKHCQKENHFFDDLKYNINQFRCRYCNISQKSKIALQRHIRTAHNQKMFFCSTCSLDFQTISEARTHRNSINHKNKVAKTDHTYKCKHCYTTFVDINDYRVHLINTHPEQSYACPHCGKGFILPQDVSRHVRSKFCTFAYDRKAHDCKTCPYMTDSYSEFIFHKVLHSESVYREREDGSLKLAKHYKCPLCGKFFVKATMRSHIRMHTNERPHACSKCAAAFVRRSSLVQHQREKHSEAIEMTVEDSDGVVKFAVDKKYLCSMCGARFKKRSILKNHMLLHTGKMFPCPEPNCVITARTQVELEDHIDTTHSDDRNFHCVLCDYRGKTKRQLMRHMIVHADTKKYQCQQCDFSTKISSNLKRHLRIHDIGKTYGCPYCSYRCKNLDNIRKHIMLTKKHPNKTMYECKFCLSTSSKSNQSDRFHTNHVKDFQVHLAVKHSDCFTSGTQAFNYISTMYELNESREIQSDYDGSVEYNIVGDEAFMEERRMVGMKREVREGEDEEEVEEEEEEVVDGMLLGFSTSTDAMENPHNPQEELLFTEYVVNSGTLTPSEATGADSWTMVTSYEVEGAGTLVPFHPGETLFHEHFQ